MEDEKQKVLSKCAQMHKFQDEKEACLLSQLENLHMEIQKLGKETLTRLSEELSRVDRLIEEMERKCQQPGCGILKDIKNNLSRWEREMVLQTMKMEVSAMLWYSNITPLSLREVPQQIQITLDYQEGRMGVFLMV